MIDYEALRIIWWALIGVLLAGFAITDGFDFGVAMLLPFIAKDDIDRRVVINTVAPVWEGNQVWFILGAGAIFAAWPYVYAVAFSGFYLAMMLLLALMILRPVAFKYRSKLDCPYWRSGWDYILSGGAIGSSLIFGIAIGNVLQGVPFQFDLDLQINYTGYLLDLFNPFALLCGMASAALLTMHGGFYVALKTEAEVQTRARYYAHYAALAYLILYAIAGAYLAQKLDGYVLISDVAHNGPSNPLHKQVVRISGGLVTNYSTYPWMILAPALSLVSALLAFLLRFSRKSCIAFLCSSLAIVGAIASVGFSLFPFMLPSSSQPNHSLLIWDASSSYLTLMLMLVVAVIMVPIVLAYTIVVYRVLRGKVTRSYIQQHNQSTY